MISRIEKERIKALLRETLTLLCKNGLPYRQEFNLEALIGITLDKKDVLLISLNEFICGDSSSGKESCCIQDGQKTHRGKLRRGRGRPPKRPKFTPIPQCETAADPEDDCPSTDASLKLDSHPDQNEANPVPDLNEDVESTSEDSSSSESECGLDDLTEDQKNLLAKMKEAVNQQIKKEFTESPSRDNTGLRPMDIEESQKIWQRAFEMARITKQADGKKKKAETCAGNGKDKCEHSEQEHQESGESMPSPMCHICGKTMSTEKNLTKHVRRHLGMFSVYCDECGKGFFDRTDLDSHTAKHKDTKLYQCDICGRSYSHKRGLYKHIRKDHRNGDKDIDDVIEKANVIEKPSSQAPVSVTLTPMTMPYPQASVHCVMSNPMQVSHTPNLSHMPDLPQPADLSQQSHLSQLHQATDLSQPTSIQHAHALALAQASVMSPPPPPPMIHPHSGLPSTPILPLSTNLPPHFQHPVAQQHPPGLHQPPYPRY
ncbi:hypothetical protein LSH36_578g01082 [Paralvinella palmiformis]|uniref:C2H2-type domain-containing protein n=1 Tax=Paralvinella palmiformis TaxID=53620 RepID=A0AAD9J6C4_9ANNE|nr:hypothetical protein LSH36_578g01082 [Paralvinella palmiformis]